MTGWTTALSMYGCSYVPDSFCFKQNKTFGLFTDIIIKKSEFLLNKEMDIEASTGSFCPKICFCLH